jgi:hypothetical protein
MSMWKRLAWERLREYGSKYHLNTNDPTGAIWMEKKRYFWNIPNDEWW